MARALVLVVGLAVILIPVMVLLYAYKHKTDKLAAFKESFRRRR